jgi:hypothetical protein
VTVTHSSSNRTWRPDIRACNAVVSVGAVVGDLSFLRSHHLDEGMADIAGDEVELARAALPDLESDSAVRDEVAV